MPVLEQVDREAPAAERGQQLLHHDRRHLPRGDRLGQRDGEHDRPVQRGQRGDTGRRRAVPVGACGQQRQRRPRHTVRRGDRAGQPVPPGMDGHREPVALVRLLPLLRVVRAPDVEVHRLQGQQGAAQLVLAADLVQPGHALPQRTAQQLLPVPAQQLGGARIGVGDQAHPVQAEHTVREQIGRAVVRRRGARVDDDTADRRAAAGRDRPGGGRPEVQQPDRAVRRPHPQGQRRRLPGGRGPQRGHDLVGVARRHDVRDRLRAVQGRRGLHAQQRVQGTVPGHGRRHRVPDEPRHPALGAVGGRRLHAHGLAVPGDVQPVLVLVLVLQLPQRRAQLLGQPGHPVQAGQHLGGVRGGGAQHGQHAVRRGAADDRHVQGSELEGQARGELGVAAHALRGVRQDDVDAEAVGVGDGELAVGVQSAPGAEQRPRQSRQHGETQQSGRVRPQVDASRVAAGRVDRLRRGVDEQLGEPSGRPLLALGTPSHWGPTSSLWHRVGDTARMRQDAAGVTWADATDR